MSLPTQTFAQLPRYHYRLHGRHHLRRQKSLVPRNSAVTYHIHTHAQTDGRETDCSDKSSIYEVGTLIVATIYLQMIQNRYMFRSFTVLQCTHQHCVQPVASDVEVVGYL